MTTAQITRASVFAIKLETTEGTLLAPSAAGDFIPLRSGFEMTPNIETLDNDELVNDLGASKAYTGKQSPSGKHDIYMKHSETEGTAPEWALLLKTALGAQTDNGTEYDTIAGSDTTKVVVDSGEGASFAVGQALLIKDIANGLREIRNVASISTDDLTHNFSTTNSPGVGVNLGKCIAFAPANSGHPTFSAWLYLANGGAIQAMSGCRVTSVSIEFPTGQQATCSFSYEGNRFYFNPLIVSDSNKYIDLTDGTGTVAATVATGIYESPIELATAIKTALDAASAPSDADTFTVTFSSSTGKFTIASDGTVMSLLWKTGTHGADNADDHIGTLIGFSDAADDTGALTYTADSALSYAAAYTPSYDNADSIIVKEAEIMIGDSTDNSCRKAQNVSITIDTPTVDVDSICAESGLLEKLPGSRTVSLSCSIVLEKHEAHLFDKFINNTTTQVMVNVGAKDNSGNWVEGKCVNVYFGNATISAFSVSAGDYIVMNLEMKGFVDTNKKDVYINLV